MNRYQSFVDLSDQIELGRAVLVGRGPAAASMEVNGAPLSESQMNRHDTIYRFLLPVAKAN